MADDQTNKTISKTRSGFPPYLDFDKLRSDAIGYLGKLSGKIWTDHNIHDPGITILESLIYALLDLGYRTNLPVEDLLSRNSADSSPDNNFLNPAQILCNNPLTITDYRKMLVDIEYVKNAWLVIEEKMPVNMCKPAVGQTSGETLYERAWQPAADPCDNHFLNGLYHVYVQLEERIENHPALITKTISKIRKSLMAHRNLCEDFIDITILCKLDIGVCAQIELDDDADPEEVFLNIVETLTEFFSPAPVFYSLLQLLDRGKAIDDIFAGRPYNVTESHGFVDTGEFEKLTLRKELHLSDVYHLLFDISGIINIRNLEWITCCDDKTSRSDWKLVLPENYIPQYSVKCSGFSFTKKGMPLQVDLNSFESFVQLKLAKQSKALYREPSPFLDPEYPKGIYRSDLADYYSIQNDFPRVYGIGEGTLSADITDQRRAQALQLQGFLLFFDQLLANYLMQLKNMRSLFAFSPTGNASDRHTYFSGQLTSVPQYEKLLRFGGDGVAGNILGTGGTILAYPTDRKKLQALIEGNKLTDTNLDRDCNCGVELPPYAFCFGKERDQAVKQLQDDFLFGSYEPVVVANYNDCYFFYFLTSSPDIALISKRYYRSRTEANNAAASIQFVATIQKNYRNFREDCCEKNTDYFSFNVELNLESYVDYLQIIVEDEHLYMARRQQFLDHLLSRFAERFTDFAMLSTPFWKPDQLERRQIQAEELYLRYYGDLSSNRGKAYDYLKNNWGNYNISGFEKRFKALAGMENWRKHYLCNFVVEPADILYQLSINFFNESFAVKSKTVSKTEALTSYHSIYQKLTQPVVEYASVEHENKWEVFIRDDNGNRYAYSRLFDTRQDARIFSRKLDNVFKFRPSVPDDIFVNRYIHKVQLKDPTGMVVAEAREHFPDEATADAFAAITVSKPNGQLQHTKIANGHRQVKFDKLIPVQTANLPYLLIDEDHMEFRSTEVIHIEGEKKTFSIINRDDQIQFNSLLEFDDVKQAKKAFRHLITRLPINVNYLVERNRQTEFFEIFLTDDDDKIAVYFNQTFLQEKDAVQKMNEIIAAANAYTYTLSVTPPISHEWEFNYISENLSGDSVPYTSQGHYKTQQAAQAALQTFYTHFAEVKMKPSGDEARLVLNVKDQHIQFGVKPSAVDTKKADQLLQFSQQLYAQVNHPAEKDFMALLNQNIVNPGENYIYKLVDKDYQPASYPGFKTLTTQALAAAKRNELIGLAYIGYDYVDIASGGNIIHIRKDANSKTKWYHYRIVCNNRKYLKGSAKGKDLVLFESTVGYTSEQSARDAFTETYLQILKRARNPSDYGPGKYISLEELLLHDSDSCNNNSTVVFVPSKTSAEYEGYEVEKELALLAASYPIRYLKKKKFRFLLGRIDEVTKSFDTDWQSNLVYKSPEEAMCAFRFFLILLKYAGNFCMEWNPMEKCFIIFMRETLALSAHGFADQATAWGPEGVEKFICVAQSQNGFHNYQRLQPCTYGFFVSCGNTGLIHPCGYDTASRRDAILQSLYKTSSFNFLDLLELTPANEMILHDNDAAKTPLAIVKLSERNPCYFTFCEALVLLAEAVYDDKNFVQSGSKKTYQLNANTKTDGTSRICTLAKPYDTTLTLPEWKQRLQKLACWIPVAAVEDACGQTGNKKYFVSIRLPGFNSCADDLDTGASGSGSPCTEPGCNVSCYLAWKSECCFDTCCDAFYFYTISLLQLSNFENYKPVFDCPCNDYGIELHQQLSLKQQTEFTARLREQFDRMQWICQATVRDQDGQIVKYRGSRYENNFCNSDIVAFNPQYYSNDKMACEAVIRAKKQINSEGLHLVEHILLRPHCLETDCGCVNRPKPAGAENHCEFTWVPGGDKDPCGPNDENPIPFTPGCDPYSFIATVALPAWPERFRLKANRTILEKMMQREAPAHVLLRILWLNPREFCCFEAHFKLWNEWLGKKLNSNYYNDCDFLGFLFRKKYAELPECKDCAPCSCDDQPSMPCLQDTDNVCDRSVLENIHDIYGWSTVDDYDFAICETLLPVKKKKPARIPALVAEPVTAPDATVLREKTRQIRIRATHYEESVHNIETKNPGNKTAADAATFLKKPSPTPAEFSEMAEKILKDKTDSKKGKMGMSKLDKQTLIENMTCQYFDRIFFPGKDVDKEKVLEKGKVMEKVTAVKGSFELMQKKRIDTDKLFETWDANLVKELEPSIDIKKIKKLITGK